MQKMIFYLVSDSMDILDDVTFLLDRGVNFLSSPALLQNLWILWLMFESIYAENICKPDFRPVDVLDGVNGMSERDPIFV